MKCLKKIILAIIFAFIVWGNAAADTLYLKNGRSIEGIIKKEDANAVELEISGGVIKFNQSEITKIDRTSPGDQVLIRQEWEQQKIQTQQRIKQQKIEESRKPKKVNFSGSSQNIILPVTLNGAVSAVLVLDTGASIIMLRKHIAVQLGMDVEKVKPDMQFQVADGRYVNAKRIILKSVKAEDAEAENVEAAVLLDEVRSMDFDGLLGMSFLKRFNFQIDQRNKKLILEGV